MPPQKRKSPDRRKPNRQNGLASRLLLSAGRAAARHPRPLFGVASLGVVFSFVAANALWYQAGEHPHPLLATRDQHNPNAIAGYRPMRAAPLTDVTTFRIERADRSEKPDAARSAPAPLPPVTAQQPSQSGFQPMPVAAPIPRPPQALPQRPTTTTGGEDPVAAAIRAAERTVARTATSGAAMTAASGAELPPARIPNTASTPAKAPPRPALPTPIPVARRPNIEQLEPAASLVLQIQRGLSNIAYADVETDGIAGSQTRAAIRRFQRHYRLPETGEPDQQVLKKLKSIGAL